MSDDFVKVKVHVGTRIFTKNHTIEMQKGCLFQNNGGQYIVDDDGQLKFRKDANSAWEKVDRIDMTKYQWSVFQNIANNDKNAGNYSREDISLAWQQFAKGDFCDDLSEELPKGYRIERNNVEAEQRPDKSKAGKSERWVEAFVGYHGAKGEGEIEAEHSARLRFQIAKGSYRIVTDKNNSTIVEYYNNPDSPKILTEDLLSTTTKKVKRKILGDKTITEKNEYLEFQPASTYKIKKGETLAKVIKRLGIDYYELFAANPQLNYKVTYSPTQQAKIEQIGFVKEGQEINIPARYKIKPGSVKNLDDVIKATGVTEEYLKNVLLKMEPKTPDTPDLHAYYDGVNGKGVLTIGYGHTGSFLDGKPLKKDTVITEEQAYEILAQDILNNKIRTIAYFEQHGISKEEFDKIPKSLQSVLIDIPFNKGVFDGFENEHHDYTSQLKTDINNEDYAAATIHTIRLSRVAGLEKRSMYRLITAMEGLSEDDFIRVKNDTTAINEMTRVIQRLRDKNHITEANKLQEAWDNVRVAD